MSKRSNISAGLLLFRRRGAAIELFLAHPGGPFWKSRDIAAWTIPKGEVGENEDLLDAARREFQEETGIMPQGPFVSLGSIRQKAGKIVHAWAWEGDADALLATSNTARTQWPRGSGNWITYPEVDRCEWFSVADARERINEAQAQLIDRLEAILARGGTS
jgi:predicted NUDIX family NTP pyrophosphohydrolase